MKICILGGGLTSLVLAKGLANQDIYVDIFSNQETKKISKTRTLGISKKMLNFLTNIF